VSEPTLGAGTAAPIAGWYGKIPALGDFASRRLSSGFVKPWDGWLQRALVSSRASLRERWQDIYCNSPIWRFALLPGVCGNDGWTGIMMPSVDKVGRHFPFTIALPIEPHPELITTVFAAQDWFAAIEQIALSSLSMDFEVVELESRLAATPFGTYPPADHPESAAARELARWWTGQPGVPIFVSLPDSASITGVLRSGGLDLLSIHGVGKSLWWTHSELAGVSQLHGFSGLPPDDYFAVLLAGIASRPISL
jgi:type VI secretion system protein ImpM